MNRNTSPIITLSNIARAYTNGVTEDSQAIDCSAFSELHIYIEASSSGTALSLRGSVDGTNFAAIKELAANEFKEILAVDIAIGSNVISFFKIPPWVKVHIAATSTANITSAIAIKAA